MDNFKHIHIGDFIKKRVVELNIENSRICNFLNTTENEIEKMYQSEDLNSAILLRWSKLLEYDFFRIYSKHLILYSPPSPFSRSHLKEKKTNSLLPHFKKNIYTIDIIHFILELIETGKKTKQDVMNEYRIPKTTLYKWMDKYKTTN